jgi:hypothetical protein
MDIFDKIVKVNEPGFSGLQLQDFINIFLSPRNEP